ncbi:hypothetical protein [Ornithinibacillus contaminans]|uniref:hypothetical protein n=1 Tax=Ornithinibacillus contaminans TaxID=694055 RepID=UPI0012ECC383|nr:hypothetical protein [Ornithinibacillus contaminans]
MKEEIKYKRATVKIPKITLSHSYIKLKKENERVIRHLDKLERGHFGIKKWFNKNDR